MKTKIAPLFARFSDCPDCSFAISPHQKTILQSILAKPVSFIPHSWFRSPLRMKVILSKEVFMSAGTLLLEEDLQTLFLQLNYSRYRMNILRRNILKGRGSEPELFSILLAWHEKQMRIREKIVTSNMGLVLAMVKHTHYTGVEITDLISDGSVALLQAAEKFDCSLGFKFSTYACRAILRSFSRVAKKSYRYRGRFPLQLDLSLQTGDVLEQSRDDRQNDMVEEIRMIYRQNLAELSDTEQAVVDMRFSMTNRSTSPLTLKQTGNHLGLSKERIRQIQTKALTKLRVFTEERLSLAGDAINGV